MPNSASNIVPPKYLTELKSPVSMPLNYGDKSYDVKRVQEWLILHGANISVDGDYGPATALAVANFKNTANIGNPADRKGDVVDMATWSSLSLPLVRATALAIGQGDEFRDNVVRVARQYLAEHPREVGGDNKGVWQRHFSRGRENQPWCQDFVSTVWFDAARNLKLPELPFALCDGGGLPSSYVPWVAEQARLASKFALGSVMHTSGELRPGTMFFVRSNGSYSHVGIVISRTGDTFTTIEGNTNDEGSPNGYEVCERTRTVVSCDFGLIA